MNLHGELLEILNQIGSLKVESTLILGAIGLLIAGLIHSSKWLIKGLYAIVIVLAFFFNLQNIDTGLVLADSLFLAELSKDFTSIFLFVGLLILIFKRTERHITEFYFFVLSIIVGGVLIMKGNSFLVTYLSVELLSFSAYVLTNFSFQKASHEAGIKYLLFGAISSALMLFGFGIVYGVTDTFFFHQWSGLELSMSASIGVLLILFGLFFKATIVPFHIWVPAAYQSAPNDAVAIFSIIPKLAALVLLQRIIVFLPANHWIITVCFGLGMITILFGTLSALRQSHARRMIGLGAIAHSGFLLPLVLISSTTAIDVFWWYAVVYAIMNVAIFYFLDQFERNGFVDLKDYARIGSNYSLVPVAMTVVLVSLVGIPPVAGFTAKFLMFSALWESYANTNQGIYMAYLLVALFGTLLSLFFYLRIPYFSFLVKNDDTKSIESSFLTKFFATLFAIVLLLLFFAPQII